MPLVGRHPEKAVLDRLLTSNEAEFLALYGRRRVGKTFLIREHFKKQLVFELTGLKNGPMNGQLASFHQELTLRGGKPPKVPETWQEAFQQLAVHLKSRRATGKHVVFLDELRPPHPGDGGGRSAALPEGGIVRRLASEPQGLSRSVLTDAYTTGGRLTETLRELEEAGFISSHVPFGKKSKDTIYRLTDEYSLFYLKWIDNRRTSGAGTFLKIQGSPGWRAWSGYALESLAHKHLPQIKRALGIAEVETNHCSWIQRPDQTWPDGAQLDLLIDRADNTINVIEIKFSQGPFTITKNYAGELRRKIEVFRNVSGTRKNVFLTFLTTHGITQNAYAKELVQVALTTDDLFSGNS